MYLPQIINDIKSILVEEKPRNHNNYPNIYGVFNQSELVIDISEGESYNSDPVNNSIIKLVIKVSLAIDKKSTDSTTYLEGEKDLDSMISFIIYKLRGRVVKNSERIKFVNFQKFTPESGKFRALIELSVNCLITPLDEWMDNQDGSRIEEIRIRNI